MMKDIKEYKTILNDCEGGLVREKSKFIANLYHIESEDEAKERINEIRKKYYDAKHHVYAYIVNDESGIVEKFSDDGEPSQTAGKPLFELIKKNGITNVLIVVTRYFGGILLGTGGLYRAYLEAGKICFNNAQVETMIYSNIISIDLTYSELDIVKNYCEKNNIIIDNIEYTDNIMLYLIVCDDKINDFEKSISNILSRNIDISIVEKKYVKK